MAFSASSYELLGSSVRNEVQLSNALCCIVTITGKCVTRSVSWMVAQAQTFTAWTSASCTPRSAQRRDVVATKLPNAPAIRREVTLLRQNARSMPPLPNKQFNVIFKYPDHLRTT